MWNKIDLGLYAGLDKNNINYTDLLPTNNSVLSIMDYSSCNANHLLKFGIFPIYSNF